MSLRGFKKQLRIGLLAAVSLFLGLAVSEVVMDWTIERQQTRASATATRGEIESERDRAVVQDTARE